MKALYNNEYPLDLHEIDGDYFVSLRTLYPLIFEFKTITSVTRELKNVSLKNYKITGSGRGRLTLINGNGLSELLSRTIRLSYKEKLEVVKSLKSLGLNITEPVSSTRKELDFFDDISDFLGCFNIEIERQFEICGFLYDFKIGNLIVEYDEAKHAGYNKALEADREKITLDNGMRFIRVSDDESNAKNIGLIFRELSI